MALLFAWLAMFGPFSIDPIFPAFSQLSRSLVVDQVAIQQTISVYLLAYGLMSIAHGPLSDAWGRADDPGRAGVVHRWLDRVCAVARLAQVAGVPRAAGPVGWRGYDRRAGDDPRPVQWTGCAAADAPCVDDFRHCTSHRADHRRLDPAQWRRLAVDLPFSGGVRPGAAGRNHSCSI